MKPALFDDDLRLGRLTCGKALPFRKPPILNNVLCAGWKARPSSLRRGKQELRIWPESRRLSASQGGRAALSAYRNCQFGQPWFANRPYCQPRMAGTSPLTYAPK
jgi:hypothetical protein